MMVEKIIVIIKYLHFADIFLKKAVVELSECFAINKDTIDLELDKQPPYGLIYNLGLVEFKSFKFYIKTNLANDYICLSKSPARAPILFI